MQCWLRDGFARSQQAAGIAERAELQREAELVVAAAAALDHRKVGSRQGPMADRSASVDGQGKQVLKLRLGERAASRHGGCPK